MLVAHVSNILGRFREVTEAIKMRVFNLIIWLQQYVRSDWLLSGHYFLVMTGHCEIHSHLDGSFEL